MNRSLPTFQGNCVWVSDQGHTIKLRETTLGELTDVERKILCQLAIGKINQFNLGVNTESLLGITTNALQLWLWIQLNRIICFQKT